MQTVEIIDIDFYNSIMENLYEGVYLLDREGRIIYWNKGAVRLSGHESSHVLGKYCWDNILSHDNEQGLNLCTFERCPAVKSMEECCIFEKEAYFCHKNGHQVPVTMRTSPVRNLKGQIIGAVKIFNDNMIDTKANQKIRELEKMAMMDYLTGLGNIRYAEINLRARLEEMQRYHRNFGVFFIDIDHFKNINDKYGHDFGNKILKNISEIISSSLRTFDIICRWGGDEFVAIVINVNETQLFSIAERLRMSIENCNFSHVLPDVVQVTVSIGAAMAQSKDTVSELLKRADDMMYCSKASGRNCISIDCKDSMKKDIKTILEFKLDKR